LYKKFDVAFLSPPFYDKELYEGELTSTSTYKNINEWYNKFYKPMFMRAAMAVKKGGHILAYIPDGRMRQEAHFILKEYKYTYLGIVAFRTITKDTKPQIRDTFVWRCDYEEDNKEENIEEDNIEESIEEDNKEKSIEESIEEDNKEEKMIEEENIEKTIEELLPCKHINNTSFKLGQKMKIISEFNENKKMISSEEKYNLLKDKDLMILEIPQIIKKVININILTYQIIINNIHIYKYYLSIGNGNNQKIIDIHNYSIKIINEINRIIKKIPNITTLNNMSMIECEFSIDNEDIPWISNIKLKPYICKIHKKMIFNQIKSYKTIQDKMYINDEILIKDMKDSFIIYFHKKRIGIFSVEKNNYGFEISILLNSKYRKKEYIFSILFMIYEYIHYIDKYKNELVYLEFISSGDKEFIKCCKYLGFKNITAFGHTKTKIYKIM